MDIYEAIKKSATSIGLVGKWDGYTYYVEIDGVSKVWNPLENESDALLLLMNRDIQIYTTINNNGKEIGFHGGDLKVVFKTPEQRKQKYLELITRIAAGE